MDKEGAHQSYLETENRQNRPLSMFKEHLEKGQACVCTKKVKNVHNVRNNALSFNLDVGLHMTHLPESSSMQTRQAIGTLYTV